MGLYPHTPETAVLNNRREPLERFSRRLSESQGQNLGLTVFDVPYSQVGESPATQRLAVSQRAAERGSGEQR